MSLGFTPNLSLSATSGGFNPASLFAAGEQGYWLDPSDFGTMFQDAAGTTPVTEVGQSVQRILDKSGRGNHFTQATAANAPVLQQDAGGKLFLLFDGTDDWLQSVATINPGSVDKAQVFAGVRKLSDVAVGMILETGSGNLDGSINMTGPSSAGLARYSSASRGTVLVSATTPTSFAAPITNVVTALMDISAPSAVTQVNGAQVAISTSSQGTGNYLTYTHFIGRRNGSSLPFNGRLYQIITRYGPNLASPQIAQAETFVNQRTGAF